MLCEILPFVKNPLVANAHPLQVDPGIGFLCTFEGFGFARGWLLEAARRRAASPQVHFEKFFVYFFNLGEIGLLHYIRRCH